MTTIDEKLSSFESKIDKKLEQTNKFIEGMKNQLDTVHGFIRDLRNFDSSIKEEISEEEKEILMLAKQLVKGTNFEIPLYHGIYLVGRLYWDGHPDAEWDNLSIEVRDKEMPIFLKEHLEDIVSSTIYPDEFEKFNIVLSEFQKKIEYLEESLEMDADKINEIWIKINRRKR